MAKTEAHPRLAGRYALGAVIGQGGMGDVHAGHDERLGRDVAIKLLREDLARRPELRGRFEAEARAAARLTHPNIVAIYDTGETDDGIPYIVMERLPGRTLADEIEQGPIDVPRTRRLAAQVLDALAAAHDAGIVHRDVKPGNVLLTHAGDAKVSDFGIAKSIDDDQTTGVLFGTAAYVAPERLLGERATPASDLYGVGVVMYEALSGRKPFVADSPLGVVRAVQQGKAAPLDDVDAPDLRAVVERAMAKDPSRRYPSARDMGHALEAPMEDPDATVPVHAPRAATQTMTLPRPPVPGRGKPARRAGISPRVRAPSRRALVVAALAVVLVISAVLAVVSMSGGDGRVPITSSSARSGSQATATSTPTPGVSLPPRLEHALDALEEAVRR